jgi:membrane-associated protease RseP (regulator of RpoE activity)
MLAAGSSANFVTALLALLLLSGLFAPPAGILIYEVAPDGPLARSGFPVQRWDVIQAINGTDVSTYERFSNYMLGVGPNVTLTLTVLLANQRENITIATAPSPANSSRGLIGFDRGFIPVYNPSRLGLDQYSSVHLSWILFWIYLLGLSVAIFNMFPLYPFDGERFLYYPLERLVGKHKLNLRKMLNVLFLGLLAGNMILSFVRYGLLPI